MTAQGSSRVEEERDKLKKSRGSHSGDAIGRKRQQHHLGMIAPTVQPEGVIPEKAF